MAPLAETSSDSLPKTPGVKEGRKGVGEGSGRITEGAS